MIGSWRRALGIGVVLAVVVAGLVFAFMPQPVPVDIASVVHGPLRVTIDEEGRTRVKDVYVVSSPLAGRALRTDVEAGDFVSAGETVIAMIEPTAPAFLDIRSRREREAAVKAAEAALTLAEADRERAQAELSYAQSELRRAESLVAREAISKAALDRAVLDAKSRGAALETTVAAVAMQRFELETARAALIDPGTPDSTSDNADNAENCCVPVTAPVDGRVLRVFHESEAVVGAGTPLVEIGDPQDLQIVAELLSSDAVQVAPDAPVLIDDWGGTAALTGEIARVEPYGFTKVSALGVEEQRVNVIVDFTDPPEVWRPLGHGYRVTARIIVWQADNVLKVPVSALFRLGDRWAVFVVQDGRARSQIVEIGHRSGVEAEVNGGLAAGDVVVIYPSDLVVDGVAVEPRSSA